MKKTQLKALLWVLGVCSASARGPPKLIGSSQPIVATQGDDVIIPCHVEPPVEEEQLIVEWWRPDQPPGSIDPRGIYRYVHRYHDNQDEEDLKMKMYAGRTMLFREELKHCNVSLKIMDLKLSDGGWYRCLLPLLKSRSRATDIRLLVETRMSSQKATSQPTTAMLREETEARGRRRLIAAGVVFIVLILGGGGTLWFKQVSKRRKWDSSHQSPVQRFGPAEPGPVNLPAQVQDPNQHLLQDQLDSVSLKKTSFHG